LEKLAVRTLVDKDRYAELSELAAHPVPGRSPQSYFPLRRSLVGGGIFQPVGLLTALNELALATALVGVPTARLMEFELDEKRRFKEVAVELIYTVGGVQVLDPERMAAVISGS
jgi:hypothetical protein